MCLNWESLGECESFTGRLLATPLMDNAVMFLILHRVRASSAFSMTAHSHSGTSLPLFLNAHL